MRQTLALRPIGSSSIEGMQRDGGESATEMKVKERRLLDG